MRQNEAIHLVNNLIGILSYSVRHEDKRNKDRSDDEHLVDIKRRLGLATGAFGKLDKVWKNKKVKLTKEDATALAQESRVFKKESCNDYQLPFPHRCCPLPL